MNTKKEKLLFNRASQTNHPINGSLELLPLCNMNCNMCYVRLSREEMEQTGRLRRLDEWIDVAHQMKEAGVLFLLLTGGEPLLYPHFKELYLELKKMGMIITINSNGTLIDEEWAEFFGKNKPRRMNITLYGTSEETYEKLCHYPGGFQKTLAGIRRLREKGVDVKIGVSLTKENQNELEEFFELGRQLDAPVNIDTYMQPAVRERRKSFDLRVRLHPKDAAKAHIRMLEEKLGREDFVKSAIGTIEEAEHFVPGEEKTGCMSCYAGRCSFTINWQGEMRPCVILSTPSISVFEEGFEKAWSYIVGEVEKIRLSSKCTVCNMRSFCQVCGASALYETGSYEGTPEYLCEYSKEILNLLKKSI